MAYSTSTRSFERSARLGALALAFALGSWPVLAAPPADIDATVDAAMKRFGVPGMSVAIVEGDKTVHAKGYGVRELGKPEKADEHTVFPIGSETKAFTAAALGILVDQGKLKWSDPVVKHMPEFRMHDPYVTEHMTVRDLLTHRSGLGLGQGDLLIIPSTDRSRTDIVHALRYLKPKTGFREEYAYDNILYIVAGQLVQAVSGRTWEDVVRSEIFKKAGMKDSTVSDDVEKHPNHVALHARTDGPIRGMGNIRVLEKGLDLRTAAPAGAINASALDMARWMSVLIGGGTAPGGTRVFSKETLDEMWKPVVVVPSGGPIPEIRPITDTYALGWFVRDYRGKKIITHSGGVLGAVAVMAIIPEKNVGISVAINSEDVARWAVFYRLLDHYLELPPLDWATKYETARNDMMAKGLEALKKQPEQVRPNTKFSLPLASYAGVYRDPWYGTMTISNKDNGLWIRFDRTPGMEGGLEPVGDDTFRTRWTDRSIEDAYVTFAFDGNRKMTNVKMRAVSPLADFSFDYHDLEFVRQPSP
jgi:CubicO group peptidase (beta-lactamase class C family)